MNSGRQRDIIALLCNDMGVVREVLADELDRFESIAQGLPLTAYFHPSSLVKAQIFLQEIQDKGIALDWELAVPTGKTMTMLRFTGIRHDRQMIVVGARDMNSTMELYEEFLSMHGDQITLLRAEVKRRKELAEQLQQVNLQGYEEVTRLNNELVTMQRTLVKKSRELEALNQQKNMFLGIAAHDLRNPIGNILNLNQMVQSELTEQPNSDCIRYFELIDSSCRFLLRLISDLLDFSQIESGKLALNFESVDLDALMTDQVSRSRIAASAKGITLHYSRADEQSLVVHGDRNRLAQVVDNLLSNALKFSSSSDQVKIDLYREKADVVFTIRDQGPGISLADQERLFEPFVKGSSQPTGGERSTGLGLSIVKRIVEAHGGIVGLESEVGQGTLFRVRLPAQ